METNMFENAKFGDAFQCENGNIATFEIYDDCDNEYMLRTLNWENHPITLRCKDNGKICDIYRNDMTHSYDIVSKYKEPIDKDEMRRLSTEYIDKQRNYILEHYTTDEQFFDNFDLSDLADAFEAGYSCK